MSSTVTQSSDGGSGNNCASSNSSALTASGRSRDPDGRWAMAVASWIPSGGLAGRLVGVEPDRLAKIVHEAEVMRLLNVTAVIEVLDRCPQRRGAAALRALLNEPAPADNREFVRRYLGFCKRYALPQPEVSAYLNARLPHLTEADMYYRRERLVVELDGAAVHLTRKRFESDRRRDSALLALDIPTVRVTWRRLTTDAASLAAELHEILARRRVSLTTQSVAQPSQ